jgi:hypothetical protein
MMMNNTALEPLLLSPAEVGQLIGLSRSKVFELIASGQLPPSNSPQTDGGRPDGSYILPHASSGVQHISQILPAVMANIRYRMQKRGMVSDG